jgi:hypothetical protein
MPAATSPTRAQAGRGHPRADRPQESSPTTRWRRPADSPAPRRDRHCQACTYTATADAELIFKPLRTASPCAPPRSRTATERLPRRRAGALLAALLLLAQRERHQFDFSYDLSTSSPDVRDTAATSPSTDRTRHSAGAATSSPVLGCPPRPASDGPGDDSSSADGAGNQDIMIRGSRRAAAVVRAARRQRNTAPAAVCPPSAGRRRALRGGLV